MANLQQYEKLVPSQNQTAVNFMATVDELAQPSVDLQNLYVQFTDDFDLDLAFGAQLDVCGQWIGLNRTLRAPILNVYFSFDTLTQGFDEGVWQSPTDPTYGLVTLDDATYRTLLKAKALANGLDGSLNMVQQVMALIVSSIAGAFAFAQDNGDMTMTLGLSGTNPPTMFQYLIYQQ